MSDASLEPRLFNSSMAYNRLKSDIALANSQIKSSLQIKTFATINAAKAATIDPDVTVIQTSGYYLPGDGGAAQYVRGVENPNIPGSVIQSQDGSWWVLAFVNREVNVRQFGAKGDGVFNDSPAFKQAAEFVRIKGGGTIIIPKTPQLWLMGDDPFYFGTFRSQDGVEHPFPRGVVPIYPNTCWQGEGDHYGANCKIMLSPGRFLPGGIFAFKFWETSPGKNVTFRNLHLDGNYPNQVQSNNVGTTDPNHDDNVWQHGNAIAAPNISNLLIENCKIERFRGNAVIFYTDGSHLYPYPPSQILPDPRYVRNVRIRGCEIKDIFGVGIAGSSAFDVEVSGCYFHGDGFWVGAITPEGTAYQAEAVDWYIHDNIFDFRDGRLPPENTPQFATNSAQAEAARVHLRRAMCAIYSFRYGVPTDGGKYRKVNKGLRFNNNIVYQGIVQLFYQGYAEIAENEFYNYYEDLFTNSVQLSGTDTILVSSGITNQRPEWTRDDRTRCLDIRDNIIESDLEGYGICVQSMDEIDVTNNAIINCRQGGIRLDAVSGDISNNRILNIGMPVPVNERPSTRYSNGIILFGSSNLMPVNISDNQIVDTRIGSARYTLDGVRCNVGFTPRVSVSGTRAHNILGKSCNDTSNNICVDQWDNTGPDYDTNVLIANRSFKAYSAEIETDLNVARNISAKGGVFSEDVAIRNVTVNGNSTSSHARSTYLTIDIPVGSDPAADYNGTLNFVANNKVVARLTAVTNNSIFLQRYNQTTGNVIDTPFVIDVNGSVAFNELSWQKPLILAGECYVWNKGEQLLTKFDDPPVSETDGFTMMQYVAVPTGQAASGKFGQISSDGTYLYLYDATNGWGRVPLSYDWSAPAPTQ